MVIYLDNAATTSVDNQVIETMVRVMQEHSENPSGLYAPAIATKQVMDKARGIVAKGLGCSSNEVFFTASGTEANNLAILGAARGRKAWGNEIIASGFEHPSVEECLKALEEEGFLVHRVMPDADGSLSLDGFIEKVNGKTVLVTCMRVNNEVGTLTDCVALAKAVKAINRRTAVHVDGVQAFMKHPTVLDGSIDTFAVSAHKIHGPKGIGALYVRKGFHLKTVQYGGGQEQGLRSGTENVPGMAGFAKAVEIARGDREMLSRVEECKKVLLEGLLSIPGCVVNSPEEGSSFLLNVSFPGYRSETLLHALEQKGVLVSSGSACGHGERSHTLVAMNLPDARIDSALRFSFSSDTRVEEMPQVVEAMQAVIQQTERT